MDQAGNDAGDGPLPPGFEPFDHSVPKHLGVAAVASFFFFAGGQLLKKQFGRAFALWGILVAVVALMVVVGINTETRSTVGTVNLYCGLGALGLLWFYQLWDAASRP